MIRMFLFVVGIGICLSFSSCLQPKVDAGSAKAIYRASEKGKEYNNIRSYLVKESAAITDSFNAGIHSLDEWQKIRPQRFKEFIEMMGISHLPLNGKRSDLNIKITGTIQQDGYRIVKLYYESLPGLFVPANLYIPDSIKEPKPAVLYVCGHSLTQQVAYQAHPRKFAQLGFVCLIIETIQFGEVRGEHWGTYSRGWFNWFSRGYNPAGVELWNAIRAIDLLAARPEVNPDKIGVTGISGGGSQSWYIAAADPRIKAVAPVCGAGTVKDHLLNRTVDGHCDCMMPTNTYGRDFTDIGALIAPRPLLIAQANQDEMFSIDAVRELKFAVKKTYEWYGVPENISFVETPGGHSYHKTSRELIFSFFLDKLMGKKMSPEQAGDIDESPESQLSEDALKVYVNGPPKGDKTTTIQDIFIPLTAKAIIGSEAALYAKRDSVKKMLQEKTFSAFPKKQAAFDTKLEISSMTGNKSGNRIYSFVSEEGWQLKMLINWKDDPDAKKPLLIVLRNYNEDPWASENFAGNFSKNWNVAIFEPRGIGETGWDPGLQWHIRRGAAWAGRTIASMQVYDVLRCLQLSRTLPFIDTTKIGIAARDEMSVIALYAALMDGRCEKVIVKNPPPTQDAACSPSGKGPAIEMLNCLRITDVNQLPALIWPTKTIFIGDMPIAYQWAENTLIRLVMGSFEKDK